jgi:integrase
MIISMNENLRYFFKKPIGKRRTFSLVCYHFVNGKRDYQPISDALKSEVASINQKVKQGVVSTSDAETLLRDLIQTQYRKFKVLDMVLKNSTLSKINQKILNNFWTYVYEPKSLVDDQSARYDFQKALRLIEPLSIVTADAGTLSKKLKASTKNVAEIRRAMDRLNQILKFLKRDVRLSKPEEDIRVIHYITKQELDSVLPLVEDPVLQDLITTLFATGVRLSESMAITPGDIIGSSLNVDKQLTRHKKLKRPKRGKIGRIFILTFGLEAVRRWAEVEDKIQYRYILTNALATACAQAFPKTPAKWLSPHDLRHSHAIYLLGKGASLTQVSLNLRNRVEVCQKYYTGFAHTNETLEGIKRLLD